MARHYFAKAIAPPPKVRTPHPDHAGKAVRLQLGSGQHRTMSSRQLAHARGVSKGGQVTAGRANPGRFTSETARKAIQKCWATRWRKVRGRRIGRSVSKPVDHAMLRERHARFNGAPLEGEVYYSPEHYQWLVVSYTNGVLFQRQVSERAALVRLGYLKKPRQRIYVPGPHDQIVDQWTGIHPATTGTPEGDADHE